MNCYLRFALLNFENQKIKTRWTVSLFVSKCLEWFINQQIRDEIHLSWQIGFWPNYCCKDIRHFRSDNRRLLILQLIISLILLLLWECDIWKWHYFLFFVQINHYGIEQIDLLCRFDHFSHVKLDIAQYGSAYSVRFGAGASRKYRSWRCVSVSIYRYLYNAMQYKRFY